MSTAAQIAANKKNAQLSTGPVSASGRAKSSLNAVKSGLTGRTILLPGEDAAEYQRHLAAFTGEFQPAGLRECELVQSIADTWWRLRRIPALEMALFAKGRIEFANLFEEEDLAARPHLIDAHTFLAYEKQIRNLQIQEARLARRREKEMAELRTLQQQRKEKEQGQEQKTPKPAPNGFVFSTEEIEQAALSQNHHYGPAPLTTHSDSCVLTSDFLLPTPAGDSVLY
ncbi:MAG TPA: hypothetical protein VH369_09155 [Bryobacteraceae bacterium]|jgi:hypothetical protein